MLQLPQVHYITCDNSKEQYRMSYTAWGKQESSRKTLICVHGLNRNGRDWDYIGSHFAALGYYVIAPDLVGRGNSDYLKDPLQYDIPYYVKDILLLIKTLNLTNIEWIGSSLGGLVGLAIVAMAEQLINKIVLVDIGVEIERAGLTRIASYSANQPDFDSYALAKDYLLSISQGNGDLPQDVWEQYARNSLQKNAKGRYELKRDVNISKPFANAFPSDKNMELWPYWEKINISSLIIRGANSDILSAATVAKMQINHPKTQAVELPNTAHAPFLYSAEHMTMLENFLL